MDDSTRSLIYIVTQESNTIISLLFLLLIVGVGLRIRQARRGEITIRRARIRSAVLAIAVSLISVFLLLTFSFADILDLQTGTDIRIIGSVFIVTLSVTYFVIRPFLNLLEPFRRPVEKKKIDSRIINYW